MLYALTPLCASMSLSIRVTLREKTFKIVINFFYLKAVLVSGAKASEESAYPQEAVRAFHDKPVPTHDKGASSKPKVIHQPKK